MKGMLFTELTEFIERHSDLATAEHILETLSHEPLLENTAPDYAPRPAYRPLTKFEQRGLKLGHGVWDIVFQKRASP